MPVSTDPKKIADVLSRRVERVVGDLEARLRAGKKLRVKLGVDPTAPDLHLGHAVQLGKLREFQNLGHQAVLVIGDYTSLIGDPTGKSKTRPPLTKKEVEANAKTYLVQAGKVLDLRRAEIRRNSEWFSKMKFDGVLKLAAQFTVARMIERDDFAKRLRENAEIHMHELLYPMMQAYDSVMLEADVELGGTDQTFNILAGRELQKKMGQREQCCLFSGPLLVGTDGVKKMSKSLGNYVGLTEAPDEMFGKVMSIPDSALRGWFALTTAVPSAEVDALLASGKNPRDAKVRLAREIITQYHSAKAADKAEQYFASVFQKKEVPDIIDEISGFDLAEYSLLDIFNRGLKLIGGEWVMSNSDARRLITQGGVKVNGEVIRDPSTMISVTKEGILIQKGKRHFAKVFAR